MKAGYETVVVDPYDWLPEHGESAVNLHMTGLNLSVEVVYESEGRLMAKVLNFTNICSLFQSSMPGAELPDVDYRALDVSSIGKLVEFPESEAANAWNLHFQNIDQTIKHYSILFLSENLRLVVFAENFTLIDGFYKSRISN